MQENASLRAQVTQANSNRDGVEKQMIEMQRHMNEVRLAYRLLYAIYNWCTRKKLTAFVRPL